MINYKNQRGITLIALAVTIIIMLIIVAIGIGVFNYSGVIETSDNIIENKTYQEYKDAMQMVVSNAQLEFSTKNIDQSYFERIAEILRESNQFEGAEIELVYYNKVDGKTYTDNINEKTINAVRVTTKEGWQLVIDEDLLIYDGGKEETPKKESAEIEYEGIPQNWTNKNITVAIKRKGEYSDDSKFKIQYHIDSEDWKTYTGPLDIPENCTIYARIVDNYNRVISNEVTEVVDKIDKVPPTISLNLSNVCIRLTANATVKDDASGTLRVKYYFTKEGTSNKQVEEKVLDMTTIEKTESISKTFEEATYSVYAEVEDVAGNITKTEPAQTITLRHSFTSKTVTDDYLKTPVTCTTDGEYYYKCATCSASSRNNTNTTYIIEALGHDYKYYNSSGTALNTTHPTANGTYTYKCSRNCGIGTTTHTIANLATPVKKDNSKHYTTQCTSTAHSSTYYVAEATHSLQYYNSLGKSVGTIHPTSSGTYTYKCECGHGAVSHTITTKVNYNNASTHYKYKCNCGNCQLTESHTWTKTATASVCRTCECGYQDTTHNSVNGGTKAIHKKCNDCGRTLEGESSHSYSETNRVEPTCGNDGSVTKYCACGYSYPVTLAATGDHYFGYCVVGTNGTTYYTTSIDCDNHPTDGISIAYVPKLHSNVSTYNDRYIYTCVNCGGGGTRVEHKFKSYSRWKTDNGRYHYKRKCSCGKLLDPSKHKCKYCNKTAPIGGTCIKGSSTTGMNHVCDTCGKIGF